MPSQGARELPPPGSLLAALFQIVELGTQRVEYQGTVKFQPKIRLAFETHDSFMADGRPFSVGRTFTLSSAPSAALRYELESWRGATFQDDELSRFDIAQLIGCAAMIGVKHGAGQRGAYAQLGS